MALVENLGSEKAYDMMERIYEILILKSMNMKVQSTTMVKNHLETDGILPDVPPEPGL